MLKNKNLMAGTAIIVVASLYSTPVLAAGTAAGSTITNEVTVTYSVGGNPQTPEEASADVLVDRKIDLTVAASDGTATSVAPGAEDRAVSFQVTNTSNDTLDFNLSAAQGSGDDFDANTPFVYYLDDGDGVFDGGDSLITYLDEVAADTSRIVHVVSDSIPLGLDTGDISGVVLTATARAGGGASALGAAFTEAVTNTVLSVDTIFADAAGVTDSARNADHSATDNYVVLAAALSALKSSKIIAIPGGIYEAGAAIPGATVEYCITVSNASGGAAATSLTISDTLPAEVTYVSSSAKIGGADCDTPGLTNGSYAAGVVSGTIASLAAGAEQTLIFQATID